MTRGMVRFWVQLHKWSSLACTLFLLMLCLTGLPLIFHDEIDALGGDPAMSVTGIAASRDSPELRPLDAMLAKALAKRPGEIPLYMAFDSDRPLMTVTTGARPDVPASGMKIQNLNRLTGDVLEDGNGGPGHAMTEFLLQLHTDMFLGLPGELFLGVMGLVFVIAVVSGIVLYAPFMRKLDFGTLRTTRSRRLKWLDYHNLVGIVALAWMVVVGLTGVINAFVTPITKLWQANELAEMTRAYAGRPPLPPSRYGSLDVAMAAARRAIPGMNPQFIAFPGGAFSSGHHYAVFFQGATPLTENLLTTALVDAETGQLTDARPMPWYFKALSLSRPLHFGDYGGLPLKLLWAMLDLFTIVVLGSGLYLWLGRGPETGPRSAGRRAGGRARIRLPENVA
ncbi:PepSY-associated TM helix domain-containing protein [Sphingomonas sp. TREG-RG-20F-R18-01]|uniref:PepSY-associated TM helix domain-containing protein n=1 Tax=Sphingomonas sp. TREG-RG-20F-R18-01 TaxID=2914982 RepID=UPI001F55F9C3|nr:PepSY-associated TM helix domain-containing protein [Sphingomonas sp. TREG-RG-20F-R18-01]